MMSEAMAKHILECVKGGIDVSFWVGPFQIVIKHEADALFLSGLSKARINDFDLVDGYFRIELDDGVLLGLPFEEVSE